MAAFAVLLVLASLPLIGADCLIKQNCTDPGCMPVPTEPWERTPFALNGLVPPALIQCPQYANRGCCTVDQNELLMVNFLAIQSAFANVQNGGCPACAQNVEAFWCAFTCSPDQDKFIKVLGNTVMPDPTRKGEPTLVLQSELAIAITMQLYTHVEYACNAYSSCESVKTVQETSAMSQAEGFFDYQAQYEAVQHGTFITLIYGGSDGPAPNSSSSSLASVCKGRALRSQSNTAPKSWAGEATAAGAASTEAGALGSPPSSNYTYVNPPTASCCNFYVDPKTPSKGNSSCPCAYCKGMCNGGQCAGSGSSGGGGDADSGLGEVTTPWYNGFDAAVTGGTWGAAILVVITMTWWRRYGQSIVEKVTGQGASSSSRGSDGGRARRGSRAGGSRYAYDHQQQDGFVALPSDR